MDDLIHRLGLLMAALLDDGFKYVKSKFSLVKKLNDGAQIITLDLLPSSDSGKVKLAMHAHIRLNNLEDQYGPFHPFLSEKDRKTNSTIAVNCDSLMSDKSLAQSVRIDESNLDEIASRYAKAIKDYVIPFFEKYYLSENLVSSFEQEDPKSWVISDRNTRNLVLLSAYAIESKWEDFDRIASEYLDYCEKPFAQAYKPLAEAVIKGLRK